MIYGIIYKVTNNVNGKVYIGQTIRPLSERMSQHKCEMSANRSNSYLHKAMRKYGWDNFTWEIVCECSCREELNSKEIEYITLHESHRTRGKGYNLTKGGDFNPMSDPDVRRRQQQTMLISMKAFCGENNVMCRDDVKEKHHQAVISLSKDPNWIEAKRKGDDKQKSSYKFTSIDGGVYITTGLTSFCKEHNLSQSKISSVVSGNRTHHKGWKCERISFGNKEPQPKSISKQKRYIITNPDGETFVISGLPSFCKENGLSHCCMLAVLAGRQNQHKGYTVSTESI